MSVKLSTPYLSFAELPSLLYDLHCHWWHIVQGSSKAGGVITRDLEVAIEKMNTYNAW